MIKHKYKLRIPAPCGKLEMVVNDPGKKRRGVVLIAHPHPLFGGTLDNKVVQTIATTFYEMDYAAVRTNFRGVGLSDGTFDNGIGETEDLLAAVKFMRENLGDLPLILAGFSFGAFVQSRVRQQVEAQRLLMIAPAVTRFSCPPVPKDTLIIQGEKDDVVPLSKVQEWAAP